LDRSATRKPEFTTFCSGTGAAYTVNNAYFGTTYTIAKKGLAGGLVMNVIACGFAGVAFIFGLLGWLLRNRPLMVVSRAESSRVESSRVESSGVAHFPPCTYGTHRVSYRIYLELVE
jgi:hypothetical protein